MNMTSASSLRTIRDFIRYAATRLADSDISYGHGYDNPVDEAGFLVLRSLNIPLEYEEKFLDATLTAEEQEKMYKAISRRCDQLEPTAYITHEWWLTGHSFYVDERVLIPRSYIAELLEDQLSPWIEDPDSITSVLDLCTGSGCLAILASEAFPNAQVDAADISHDALDVARINVDDYGLEDVIELIQTDVFSNLRGRKYDLIISNPPYVTEEAMTTLPGEYRHEPELALVAGDDGMDIIRTIMAQAKDHLNDNGMLVVELGDGRDAFEAIWPELPVMWLSTANAEDQVFLIKKEDLP